MNHLPVFFKHWSIEMISQSDSQASCLFDYTLALVHVHVYVQGKF